jgi:hypothetical protein
VNLAALAACFLLTGCATLSSKPVHRSCEVDDVSYRLEGPCKDPADADDYHDDPTCNNWGAITPHCNLRI